MNGGRAGKVTEHVRRELAGLMLGRRLGVGVGRRVYVCRLDQRFVVKIESRGGSFQNQLEWETWEALKGTTRERWLAPCLDISGSGSVLLQRRTQAARASDYPTRMPVFIGDYKRANFGMLDGKFVCHDYASLVNLSNGLIGTRKAHWWGEL